MNILRYFRNWKTSNFENKLNDETKSIYGELIIYLLEGHTITIASYEPKNTIIYKFLDKFNDPDYDGTFQFNEIAFEKSSIIYVSIKKYKTSF